jgi:hypothetical protein
MKRGSAITALVLIAGLCAACASLLGLEDVTYSGPSSDAGLADAQTDAPQTDAARSDGPAEANPSCAWDRPFEPPVEVVGLGADIEMARFSLDELRAYVSVNKEYLAYADRLDAASTFSSPVTDLFASVNRDGSIHEYPSVSGDELTLVFRREDGLWLATRADAASPFSSLTLFVLSGSAFDPYLLPSGDTVYYSMNQDIFRMSLDASPVNQYRDTSNNTSPVLSPDGLTMYFESSRNPDGGPDKGNDTGIWVVHRARVADPFMPRDARFVAELETAANDVPLWLSPDGCRLYLRRNTGSQGIYVARKVP